MNNDTFNTPHPEIITDAERVYPAVLGLIDTFLVSDSGVLGSIAIAVDQLKHWPKDDLPQRFLITSEDQESTIAIGAETTHATIPTEGIFEIDTEQLLKLVRMRNELRKATRPLDQ